MKIICYKRYIKIYVFRFCFCLFFDVLVGKVLSGLNINSTNVFLQPFVPYYIYGIVKDYILLSCTFSNP